MADRKAGHNAAFPLASSVAEAIIDYLRNGRPDRTDRALFLTANPPFRPMMNSKKITVEASPDHPEILDIKDAMQQVMDYFDLLADQGQSDVVWNLVFASTNSPFTAEAIPVDLRTNAPAYDQVRDYVAVIERGLSRLQDGNPLDADFPAEKREVAKRFFKRNLNGIGCTTIEFGEGAVYKIEPQQAERSLAAINGVDDEEYEYLFSTFARKEFGTIMSGHAISD